MFGSGIFVVSGGVLQETGACFAFGRTHLRAFGKLLRSVPYSQAAVDVCAVSDYIMTAYFLLDLGLREMKSKRKTIITRNKRTTQKKNQKKNTRKEAKEIRIDLGLRLYAFGLHLFADKMMVLDAVIALRRRALRVHPVRILGFRSFRTQPLANLTPLPINKRVSGRPNPWNKSWYPNWVYGAFENLQNASSALPL